MLTTRNIKKLEFDPKINRIYSQLYIGNLLYARPVKAITIFTFYKPFHFVTGITVILLFIP